MLIIPKYDKHSVYRGVQIYKRKPNTGSYGGSWLANSIMFKSLSKVYAYLDYYYADTPQ